MTAPRKQPDQLAETAIGIPHMTKKSAFAVMAVIAVQGFLAGLATAEERVVSTTEELTSALEAAEPGDDIVLNPGTYTGGLYRENLREVTIRSADAENPAVIEGGSYGLQLSDPVDVTLDTLIFSNQLENGVNIDDGGSYETPATGIRILHVTVRDIIEAGNHDAIKLAGVQDFLIDGVNVENWGSEGSAIDFVGCHHGLVQNSVLVSKNLDIGGSGIRPKGGTKDVVIRANRIELPIGKGRAIQAGGVTDAEYFRFADGDADYEAKEIFIEGNVIVGGGAAFSWVNIDGGIVHHNVVHRPGQWVARILNENAGTSIVATRNGQLHDNVIVFSDTDSEFNTAINVGDDTHPETFSFARNRWFNIANPTAEGSKPELPVEETDGTYGEKPATDHRTPQIWSFPWGKWVVNANPAAASVTIKDYRKLRRAVPGDGAKFEPLSDDPLKGIWATEAVDSATNELPPMSQMVLIDPRACPDCAAPDETTTGD